MYTTFVLYKENVDTMEAINHIAWKIRWVQHISTPATVATEPAGLLGIILIWCW